MIPMDEAKAAVSAAREALSQDSGLSWIKKSSLVERAYFLGLLSGLGGITPEHELSQIGLMTPILETLRCRKGDDTFPYTKIGEAFSSLKGSLQEHPDASSRNLVECILGLRKAIEDDQQLFQHQLHVIDELLSRFPSDSGNPTLASRDLRSEQHRLLEAMEPYLRIVALLETDHLLSKRMEE